jgi:hypothetical protein
VLAVGHEALAGNLGHRVQDPLVGDAAAPQLALDHPSPLGREVVGHRFSGPTERVH